MPLIKQKLNSTSCSTLRLEESSEAESESAAWQKVAELTKGSLKTKALLDVPPYRHKDLQHHLQVL